MAFSSTPYLYLIGISGFLFFLLAVQLVYIFWTRERAKYWHRYKRKFRDSFTQHIFGFLEDEEAEARTVINRLAKQTRDITFFLELLDELTEMVKGDMRERLNELIEDELFYSFYKRKLFSVFGKNQLIACIYFSHLSNIDDEDVVKRLNAISLSRKVKLSFAAAKALQSSRDIIIRKKALVQFLQNNQASELMITELLYLFYKEDEELRDLTGEALVDILNQNEISADEKNVVVLFIAHHRYLEHADTLYEYLKQVKPTEENQLLAGALIKALAELHFTEASPLIQSYLTDGTTDLQITCVKALGSLGGEENLIFLANHLVQVSFSVQKEIIKQLILHSTPGHQILFNFVENCLGFIPQVHKQISSAEERRQMIQRIKSSALCIRSMLPANN